MPYEILAPFAYVHFSHVTEDNLSLLKVRETDTAAVHPERCALVHIL